MALFKSVRPGLHPSGLGDLLESGVEIEQGMGEARLDVEKSLEYLLFHH
jgi:hypothetical protein